MHNNKLIRTPDWPAIHKGHWITKQRNPINGCMFHARGVVCLMLGGGIPDKRDCLVGLKILNTINMLCYWKKLRFDALISELRPSHCHKRWGCWFWKFLSKPKRRFSNVNGLGVRGTLTYLTYQRWPSFGSTVFWINSLLDQQSFRFSVRKKHP